MRETSHRGTTWEADLLPVATYIREDPAARPSMVVVAAGPIAVHVDILAHPPTDAAGVARALEGAVKTAVEQVGGRPSTILVRREAVAVLLSAAGGLRGAEVQASEALPSIDSIMRAMAADMPGVGVGARIASPETWAGWSLPNEDIERLFAAAAAFHRAGPWRAIANEQPLAALISGVRTWTVSVLGNGGQEFGLPLF